MSKEQIQYIQTLSCSFHKQADSICVILNTERQKLVELLSETKPDMDKINNISKRINTLQSELQRRVISHLIEEKKLLNTEQQRVFINIIKNRLIKESQS